MAFASGSHHGLRYIKEDEFGVTPANPVMKALRHTSCSLVLNKDSFQSNELRRDAQISDLRHGLQQPSGDIGIELSYGEFDDFLAAAVRGHWEDNLLVAGIDVPTFTFESVFETIGQFQVFNGCAVNTLTLQIEPNAMVTGTIGVVGRGVEFSTTATAVEELPTLTNPPLDGFQGALKESGIPNSVITSISLSIDNGIQAANAIGSNMAVALVPNRINVTGTVSAYFENMEMLNKFVDEVESELEITLGSGGPGSYVIKLPRIKYSGGSNPVDGEGPIMLDMPFQALLDDCTNTNIQIERIPLPEKEAAPCKLTWSATQFNESVNNNGSVTENILVLLTGGNGKKFSGHHNLPLPGVVFENMPEGLQGSAIRTSDLTCKIVLTGKAANHNAGDSCEVPIKFTAASFNKGYCECAGDTVENGVQVVTITFQDGEPLAVEAQTTSIGVADSEEALKDMPNGLYIVK